MAVRLSSIEVNGMMLTNAQILMQQKNRCTRRLLWQLLMIGRLHHLIRVHFWQSSWLGILTRSFVAGGVVVVVVGGVVEDGGVVCNQSVVKEIVGSLFLVSFSAVVAAVVSVVVADRWMVLLCKCSTNSFACLQKFLFIK